MLDFASIKVKDKEYTLRFPLKAMIQAERVIGKPLHTIFTPEKDKLPDYTTEELMVLFRIGIQADQPDIKYEQADDILAEYLQEGDSILTQSVALYAILGKALGFFRVGVDIQEELQKEIQKRSGAPRNPSSK